MKIFMVTYTENCGDTYHKIIVNADNFTDAYLQVTMNISKCGVITDLFEVV